jgi:hypothetical protein|tara:strand:+ start:990 stop:1220 length:231 start_codon:yes stop_codon:yes gene_type:complete
MEYYLIDKTQPEAYLLIGTDNGFGVFWSDQGMQALMQLLQGDPAKLTKVQIKTDQNHTLDIPQFFEKIEKLQIRLR